MKKQTFKKEDLYFVPLGGCGHFGANLNLYHYGGEWLAIDCGMGFPDERYPGIDLLLPDPSFIEEKNNKLAGLIITHAHEDHIGGVTYLWPRLKCPIYATPFTIEVLKRKLEEVPYGKDVPLIEVEKESIQKIGVFDVEWIDMAHSIPDTSALSITTPKGIVLHSGDWNFDPNPMAGTVSNKDKLRKLGDKGVLAYTGDSTNACVKGRSGSETDLYDDFEKLFKRAKGKIAVTQFSSNIGRLKTVIKAAKVTDRYICPVGRSLKNMADIAIKHKLITDESIFVSEDEASYFPENRIVYVLTGSQGEGRAQLPKVARGHHPTVSLGEGDMVLFSARAIPGNEKAIIDMRNKLIARGIEVITPKDAYIHVSGHPAEDEIREMFQLIRPKCVIPVHGEHEHQRAHAEIAETSQVQHTVVPENGAVIKITEDGLNIIDYLPIELLGYDQKRIVPLDHSTVRERRKLSFNGTAFCSLMIDKNYKLIDLQLSTLGLVDEECKNDEEIIESLMSEIQTCIGTMSHKEWASDFLAEEKIRITIRRFFRDLLSIKPITIVHLSRI